MKRILYYLNGVPPDGFGDTKFKFKVGDKARVRCDLYNMSEIESHIVVPKGTIYTIKELKLWWQGETEPGLKGYLTEEGRGYCSTIREDQLEEIPICESCGKPVTK